jgi:17beta-estradiol 17-dehydrogenase / very-long-chain 3-oxoacyl-CoA reductase
MVGEIKKLDIGLLVNNVGMSEPHILHQAGYQLIVDTITVNCTSMALLSADLLEQMDKRPHKSAIINLSSFINERPLPYMSLYTGSKGFNRNLTESISLEYPHIDILNLKPYFVESPASRQKRGFMVPDRRECAVHSLKELRWEHESYGYISHRILGAINQNLVPTWLSRLAVGMFTKRMLKKEVPEARLD